MVCTERKFADGLSHPAVFCLKRTFVYIIEHRPTIGDNLKKFQSNIETVQVLIRFTVVRVGVTLVSRGVGQAGR